MLLPPVNEVWGKVIFLHPFVPLFTEGGQPASVHAGIPPQPSWHHAPPPDHAPQPLRDHAPPLGAEHAGRYGQCAGGTHPTGMQFCYDGTSLDSTSPYNPPPLHSIPFNPLHSNPPPPLRTLNVFSHIAKAKTKVEK